MVEKELIDFAVKGFLAENPIYGERFARGKVLEALSDYADRFECNHDECPACGEGL